MLRVLIALVLLGVPAWLLLSRHADGDRPPNVVLITVESLRTDHVGFMNGRRDTTPALDALAAESVVYTDAHSVTSWTLSSHASLFTGLYPTAHQAVRPTDRLGDEYFTLAEMLAEAGYQTAGVASGPYLRTAHNLNQGFETYVDTLSSDTHRQAHDDVTNPAMLDRLLTFLESERDPDRPFFLFGYFWDPHYDYIPPPPYDRRFVPRGAEPIDVTGFGTTDKVNAEITPAEMEYLLSQYDGEILWTDETLANLFEALKLLELWDDTIVIVTSDHGEEFFEHGEKGHKKNLFAESVHVPLLIKHTRGGPVGRDDRLASLVDVLPTIAELTGVEPIETVHGRSLLEPDPDPDRAIFFELLSVWYHRADDGTVTAREQVWSGVRQGTHKLVGVPGARMFLFDVAADPRERSDLFANREAHVDRERKLTWLLGEQREAMEATRAFYEAGGSAEIDEAQLERLRSLGYVD